MFHFFHRTPEIVLDCYTYDQTFYANTPIIKSGKAVPDWWRELDPYKAKFVQEGENPYHLNTNELTARDCYAIIELYKVGAILENWCDISFRTQNGDYNYWYSSGDKPETHDRKQLGNSFPNYHHIKLISPWVMRERTGVKFMWIGAEWSLHNYDIKVLPGILRFDIVTAMNVNMMFPMYDNEFVLPVGLPLGQLVPLSEKRLKINNHLVTEQEYNKHRMNSFGVSFYGWRKALQLRERNKERGTCPFHSGDTDG